MIDIAEKAGVAHVAAENVSDPAFVEELGRWELDWILVVAFGQILRQRFLDLPREGCLNVHASLLPRHRGASPIAYAIRAGDRETGITIQRISLRLDAGDILHSQGIAIPSGATAGELFDLLSEMSGPVLIESLEQIEAGTATFRKQNEAEATYAPKLLKSDGEVDWSLPVEEIDRHVRSVTPWPGARICLPVRDRWLACKILRGSIIDFPPSRAAEAGRILQADDVGIVLAGGDGGSYRIERLQPENARPMSSAEFLRGRDIAVGVKAGTAGDAGSTIG